MGTTATAGKFGVKVKFLFLLPHIVEMSPLLHCVNTGHSGPGRPRPPGGSTASRWTISEEVKKLVLRKGGGVKPQFGYDGIRENRKHGGGIGGLAGANANCYSYILLTASH